MNLRRRIPIALLSTILLHADGDPGTEVIVCEEESIGHKCSN